MTEHADVEPRLDLDLGPEPPVADTPMWLSHHWPSGYDRCAVIAGRHVCRRCLVLYPLALVTGIAISIGSWWPTGLDAAVLWLFPLNGRLIERFHGDLPDRWDPGVLPWAAAVEAAWPEIRAEIVAYLDAGAMPHTAEVSGLDPESDAGRASAPADRGAWRTVILQFFGEWITENCDHFPATVAAVSAVPDVTSIGFTALDPRSHIFEHVGPNRGALRYQLPIVVPGAAGSCRIRVGREMVEWAEGESVLFDLSVNHEAWNDSDEVRVLLMIEVPTPLPSWLRRVNRSVQRCYRLFPSYRRLPERARQLAVERLEHLQDAARVVDGLGIGSYADSAGGGGGHGGR